MSSTPIHYSLMRRLLATALLVIGLAPMAASPSYGSGPGTWWGCQAGAAYYGYRSASTEPKGVLVANPGPLGSVCAADRRAGAQHTVTIPWNDVVGAAIVIASGYEISTSTTNPSPPRASVAFDRLTYYNYDAWDYVDAASVTANAYTSCSTGQPEFYGGSALAYGTVTNLHYGGGFGAGVGQQIDVLPSGSIVSTNRRVIDTVTAPDGTTGQRFRVQPLVITKPNGSQIVLGQVTLIAWGNPC